MSSSESSKEDIASFLAAAPLFSDLGDAARMGLARHLQPMLLPAGATLMREGEEADAVYVLLSGRLRATINENGGEVPVGEIGRGEVVGEMALLTDEPRSATVQAIRDSNVLKLSKSAFSDFITEYPTALIGITRLIIRRLNRSIRAGPDSPPARTVAVVPAGGRSADLLHFSEQLAEALGGLGSAMLINGERLASQMRHLHTFSSVGERLLINRERLVSQFADGTSDAKPGSELDAQTTQWLHHLEASHDFVIYQCDPEPSLWTTRCLRQADRILLVGIAKSNPSLSQIEAQMVQRDLLRPSVKARAIKDLVLLHEHDTTRPENTGRWLAGRRINRHYHIRTNAKADFERLARVVTDRQVGLVLSGGGARGIAHVGVMKALEERGIAIDVIGGTSFGSIMAAGPAMGWNVRNLRMGVKKALVDPGRPVDYTAPLTALTKGKKATENIRKVFGDARIEDLWLPYFCISSNLSRGVVQTHTEGELWRAIRASVAIPGVFPPVKSADDDVLVDGGVMNNLPVDVMRTFCEGGTVLAVNVRTAMKIPAAELPDSGILSGWSLLARKINPFATKASVPGIVELIMRTAETGNLVSTQLLSDTADLTFNPPVDEFGLLEFEAYDDLIEVGYRHALERLRDWRGRKS